MSSTLQRVARAPVAALELANVLLTTAEASIGVTPKEVIWTHRDVTLYRYRSQQRSHAIPLLLVFALINRPEIFDLRPGGSLVEHLLGEGFDVFLVDWGVPDEEDADTGFEDYVMDFLAGAVRETLRASGQDELTLVGWCMGATMCAMYCALQSTGAQRDVRNLVLLTMPVQGACSTYARWVGGDFDAERIARLWGTLPGGAIDLANKLLKPVTNFHTTYRRLAGDAFAGRLRRDAYQTMAKWVADNPPFPGRAWAQWIQWIYREDALAAGRVRLRGERVDLRRIEQNLLIVTAAGDHIAPRAGTLAILDLVASEDVTHFDRPGGHIGLVAGSSARRELWPDLAQWLAERCDR